MQNWTIFAIKERMGRPSSEDAEKNDDDNEEDDGKIPECDWYGEDQAVGETQRYQKK